MKLVFIILSFFFLSNSLYAQHEAHNIDSIIAELKKDAISDLHEAAEDDTLALKLFKAWRNGEEQYISTQIKDASFNNELTPSYFSGIAALIFSDANISETEAKEIVSVFYALKKQYSQDLNINKYLVAYELMLANLYYDDKKLTRSTDEILALVDADEIALDEGSIRSLYNLRMAMLEYNGQLKESKIFSTTFYEKYPEILKVDHLLAQFYLGNYKLIAETVKDTNEPDPFLLMIAALSHVQLKNNKLARHYFDELIKRYQNGEDHEQSEGLISTIFEDGRSGSSRLGIDDIEEMTTFYFQQDDKKQACIALKMLHTAFTASGKYNAASWPGHTYLMDEGLKIYETEKKQRTARKNEKLSQQIALWQQKCSD